MIEAIVGPLLMGFVVIVAMLIVVAILATEELREFCGALITMWLVGRLALFLYWFYA